VPKHEWPAVHDRRERGRAGLDVSARTGSSSRPAREPRDAVVAVHDGVRNTGAGACVSGSAVRVAEREHDFARTPVPLSAGRSVAVLVQSVGTVHGRTELAVVHERHDLSAGRFDLPSRSRLQPVDNPEALVSGSRGR
jgi:hypothetical protein